MGFPGIGPLPTFWPFLVLSGTVWHLYVVTKMLMGSREHVLSSWSLEVFCQLGPSCPLGLSRSLKVVPRPVPVSASSSGLSRGLHGRVGLWCSDELTGP